MSLSDFCDNFSSHLLSVSLWKTLKRKEKEYEHEMERLAREKISTQQRLAELKNELSQCMDVMEIDRVLRQTIQPEDDQASTSTASGTALTDYFSHIFIHNFYLSVHFCFLVCTRHPRFLLFFSPLTVEFLWEFFLVRDRGCHILNLYKL